MKLFIPKDIFDNPHPPRLFLCTTSGKRIGELHNYETRLIGKWNSYSELSFSIDKTYVDVLTGETKINPLFDKAEGLRMVLAENIGYFIIQDPDTTIGDKDTKSLSCFSSEYACGQKYLDNFYINTGDITSKEVIYEQNKYGEDVKPDNMYKLASASKYDPNEKYYTRVYKDTIHYDYEQTQIKDENDYLKHFGTDISPYDILYIHGYANVQFYDKYTPELSLLHLIFENIPEWKIGDVDATLWHEERTFEEERIAVYDFLVNNVADVFRCVVEFDTLTNTVNFYAEAEDGIADNGTVQSRFETDVYISKDNLASEINVKYSTDNIKTKLKVSGAEGLDIREVNLGQNYIMNLDYYHNDDWMEQDLIEAYQRYLDAVKKYSPQYTEAMQGWVAANDKYNELMNAVPVEGNVVLVGDEFKKLYCIYGLYNSIKEFKEDTVYYVMNEDGSMSEANPQPNADNFTYKTYYIKGDYNTKEQKLIEKLTLYHVNNDIKGNVRDNILLQLRNNDGDTATIRIYNASEEGTDQDKKDNPLYKIETIIISATTGASEAVRVRDLSDWINGDLRVGNTAEDGMEFLKGFKITYIGIMGAYFVLAKDERQEATLEEYGINLLQTKYDTYAKIFQTQTEEMFSQQDYQCIVQSEQPEGEYDIGTRWLDSDEPNRDKMLKKYDGKDANNKSIWTTINTTVSDTDKSSYENYQRYIDNYEKMVSIQQMLIKKKKEAEYWAYGQQLGRTIVYNGTSDIAFYEAAKEHFGAVTRGTLNTGDVILTYTFTTPNAEGEWVIYLDGTTPYLMHLNSQGYWQAKMNAISKKTELASFFTVEQWAALSPLIREDEYIDDNFFFTTYESEEERLEICKKLMEEANKELKTLSQPSLEFSMTMANILALPEFNPLVSSEQFALGNFIRIELRPSLIKRARLLECTINFDDLSDFNCTFGNLITTKSEIDLHAELLSQAVQAGKTVATAAGTWQAGADKANKLEEAIANGLQDVTLQIGRASGQAISWDQNGLFCRKFKDGSTEEYDDAQIAIINNKLVFTTDGWKTSKAALGEFKADIDGDGQEENVYGLIAEAVVGGYVKGSVIEGGSLRIGGNKVGDGVFIVKEDGTVEIKVLTEADGGIVEVEKYASKDAVEIIDNTYRFRTVLSYDGSTVFTDTNQTCTITCNVYDYDTLITDKIIEADGTFSWIRSSSESDETWNASHIKQGANANKITLTTTDVVKNSNFACSVDFDETKIKITT